MAEINGIKVPFVPIVDNEVFSRKKVNGLDGNFSTIFQEELEKLKFSNHALKRLETRNIKLTETEISKIQSAVEKAEQKGAKDSLIMMKDTAYIINIPNKTVVTAMPLNEDGENVFTNIDSVVFA